VGVFAIARKALELLSCGIKAHDSIGCPLREPNLIVGISPYSVGTRLLARKLPLLPILAGRVVDADIAGVPLADPKPALGIRPHPPRALILGRRLINRRRATLQIDIGEIATGQRHEPDIAFGRAGDPVGSPALGCVPDLHLARLRIEPAIDAVLPCEPDATA